MEAGDRYLGRRRGTRDRGPGDLGGSQIAAASATGEGEQADDDARHQRVAHVPVSSMLDRTEGWRLPAEGEECSEACPSSARFALLRFAPALRDDRWISSEGDVVLELLRDARRRPPALGRAGVRGGGAVAGVAAGILRRSDPGPTALARAAQERELAAEAGQHHLRGGALLPALVGPLAGLELARDVDRAALAQVALGDVRQVLVEDHHAVPLGPLARVARLAVLPALRGGDPQVDDLLVALAVAHLGVPPEVAHQDHLVHAAGHRLPTSSSRGLA